MDPDSAPRGRPGGDTGAVEAAIAGLLKALGLSVATEPDLADTPARVADLYREALSGMGDPPELATFPHADRGDDVVVVRDLPFYSLCVHHLVPFFGTAHVAYLPGQRIVGISGIARVLHHYARRLQLQERLTADIADHLERLLAPRGVAVGLTARHLCMEMRGIRTPGRVETRVVRGALADPRWAAVLPAAPAAGFAPES